MNTATNFFNFAPKELSHSSFWAWILSQSICPETDCGKVANAFLNNAGIKGEKVTRVEREVTADKHSSKKSIRFDIVVYFESQSCLIIENKIGAGLDIEQLKRYETETTLNNHKIEQRIFLNTGYDFGFTTRIKHLKWEKWECISACDILNILPQPSNCENLLINDYRDWLNERIERWNKIANDLTLPASVLFKDFSDSTSEDQNSLAIGQFELAKKLFGELKGLPYHARNAGGEPYVDFIFYGIIDGLWRPWEPTDIAEYRSLLFYKVERNRVRLGQYLDKNCLRDPSDWNDTLIEAKTKRKTILRDQFINIVEDMKNDGPTLRTRNCNSFNGVMNSTIGIFDIENLDDLNVLLMQLPIFHRRLLKVLKSDGWPSKYFCSDDCCPTL